jgi:hypothetical protein
MYDSTLLGNSETKRITKVAIPDLDGNDFTYAPNVSQKRNRKLGKLKLKANLSTSMRVGTESPTARRRVGQM